MRKIDETSKPHKHCVGEIIVRTMGPTSPEALSLGLGEEKPKGVKRIERKSLEWISRLAQN